MRIKLEINRNLLVGSVADILRGLADELEAKRIPANRPTTQIFNRHGESIGSYSTSGMEELLGADNRRTK